jgi:hypothetical protein
MRKTNGAIQLVTENPEAGSNTSTVAPRIAGGDEKEPSAWEYNGATLFLGYINTGTWPSSLGESRISDSKMWS